MELISQKAKKIMEDCKIKARDAGLNFGNETLEYVVTNRDMLRLMPKNFIPTMYDYWVNDVEILQGEGKYKLYPNNPYETVINSRPPISFYNDNNSDWLNAMIFYHVLGHIDFFQNNKLFEKTWNDDFVGKSLADKRIISRLRKEKGRTVDYVIEFSRGLNNIVGFFKELSKENFSKDNQMSKELEFYFNNFLQDNLKVPHHEFLKELERYNKTKDKSEMLGESIFFSEVKTRYKEFPDLFKKYKEEKKKEPADILEFIINNSPKLKDEENKWMIPVMSIVKDTGLLLASPQIRTKIINEGWASYWHDELFRKSELIKNHEVAYAAINAHVTSVNRVGLNPYAIGKLLIEYVKELADKGKFEYNFQKISNIETREFYDKHTNRGKEAIFKLRENFSDFTLINTFVDQDFVDKNHLFVVGQRPNFNRGTIEFYVKSKKAKDYKQMLLNSLYHPPHITIDKKKTNESNFYLVHHFEGKQLVKDFIPNTMLGVEYLWGGKVQLETTEFVGNEEDILFEEKEPKHQRVLYTMENRKISKEVI
ncbi:SpoVR family protein [Candidatus Pacearchaeota archaeon]|nr:SpoVR family protein [Candidatus Pacearchaeota archaeon]